MPRPLSRAEAVHRRQEREKSVERSRKVWLAVYSVLGFLGVLGLVLAVVFWNPLLRALRHEQLRTSVDQLAAGATERAPDPTPYLRGKVVTLDKRDRSLDPVQSRLPDDIRAFSVAEAGTVALLEWDFEPTYNASGRLSGHYSTCKITLVDRERQLIVGETTVMGASSPVSQGSRYVPPGQQTALRAELQVVGYLQGLPRR